MSITKKDILNLADLARIQISEDEAESLTSDIDPVLEYVGQIKNAVGEITAQTTVKKVSLGLHNVMRDDVVTNEPGSYTEKIVNNAPEKEGDYIKVKKIL